MRKASVWICGAAALLLVAIGPAASAMGATGKSSSTKTTKPPAKTPTPAKKPPARKYPVTGEYVPMIRECHLTAEQQAQLGEKIQARKDALANFDKGKPAKLVALRKNLATARAKKDDQAVKTAENAIKVLDQERPKIEAAADAQILAVLKPDQRISWEGFLLYQKAGAALKASGLNEAQNARLRELCNEFAKKVVSSRDLAQARTDVAQQVVKHVQTKGLDSDPDAGDKKPKDDKKYGREDTKSKSGRSTGKDASRE